MIIVKIETKGESIAFKVPHDGSSLCDILGSVGISVPASQIPLGGTDEITVTLMPKGKIGMMLVSKADKQESIADFVTLCGEISGIFKSSDTLSLNQVEIGPASSLSDVVWMLKQRERYIAHPEQVGEIDMGKCPYLMGWAGFGVERVENNPEAIADFICKQGVSSDVEITDPIFRIVLETCGLYISKCANQEYLGNQLYPVLIPKQQEVERQRERLASEIGGEENGSAQ